MTTKSFNTSGLIIGTFLILGIFGLGLALVFLPGVRLWALGALAIGAVTQLSAKVIGEQRAFHRTKRRRETDRQRPHVFD